MKYGATTHNKRYTLRRLFGGSGYVKHQSGLRPLWCLRHIFAVAGMLRIPLSQPQKRRQPRTLCASCHNFLEIKG